MPRIAVLFEYSTVNGGENSILAVLSTLRELAWKADSKPVEVIALAQTEGALASRLRELEIPLFGFKLTHPDGQRLSREKCITTLQEAVSNSSAHLVHANSLAMGRLTGAAAKAGLTVPATAHLRDILKLSKTAVSDLNQNRSLVAVSNATRSFHLDQGLDSNRTVTIYNGIDVAGFVSPSTTRLSVRAELGIPENARVVLTVGQIGLRKGLDTLAQAACLVSDHRQGVHWILVGERFSMKEESIRFEADVVATFEKAIPRLTLHRTGYRNDVPRLMAAADVLAHSARQEPFGRVLLEAAAVGLPIVATRVGGTQEMFPENDQALLVPPDNPGDLASAVLKLLGDQDLAFRMATSAGEHVRARFTVENSAHALLTVWRNALY